MKKFMFIVLISLCSYGLVRAQAIETGCQNVNIGIGLLNGYMFEGGGLPSINFAYETLPFEKLGIGYISVGGFGAFKHSKHDYSLNEYDVNYLVAGGRAAYHFDFYSLTSNDFFNYFDAYAGAFVGIKLTRYEDNIYYNNETSVIADYFIGCRYKFTDNFTCYAESNGMALLSVGLSFLF